MPLEFEPLPEEPAPSAGTVRRGRPPAARARRRQEVLAARPARLGSPRSLARSVGVSLGAHALAFLLLWALFLLVPREAPERPVRLRISLAEAADPEAEAGGRDERAEVRQEPDAVATAKSEHGGLLAGDEESEPSIGPGAAPAGSVLLGRTAGRERLLQEGGGDDATEGALRLALAWLARHQADDGTWNASAFRRRCGRPECDGAGDAEHVEATTALALLPFLGAGHTHRDGEWRDTVRRGLLALLARQREDGSFGPEVRRGYPTGIAALALAEAYGMTGSPSLREPAQRAADRLVRAQSGRGGWRYRLDGDEADTSVSGWCTLALASARRAGLAVPETALRSADAWFASVQDDTGDFGYAFRGGGSAALLGVGSFCRIVLGEPAESPRLARTFDLLERRLPRPARGDSDTAEEYGVADPMHWYYGGLATFQRGGPTWRAWNSRLRDTLLPTQVRDATDARGSWPPMGATGRHGGRVITTALCALSLEVYYRYPRATWR